MTRWEYLTVMVPGQLPVQLDDALNRYGMQGWELSVIREVNNQHFATFKRSIAEKTR